MLHVCTIECGGVSVSAIGIRKCGVIRLWHACLNHGYTLRWRQNPFRGGEDFTTKNCHAVAQGATLSQTPPRLPFFRMRGVEYTPASYPQPNIRLPRGGSGRPYEGTGAHPSVRRSDTALLAPDAAHHNNNNGYTTNFMIMIVVVNQKCTYYMFNFEAGRWMHPWVYAPMGIFFITFMSFRENQKR